MASAKPETARNPKLLPRLAKGYNIVNGTGGSKAGAGEEAHAMGGIEVFRDIFLFKELTNAELAKVINLTQKVSYNAGDVIFKRGAPGDALYLIREGLVDVLAPSAEGEEAEDVVATLGEGDLFGEMALVEGEPRSATVCARTETKMWRIKKEYFDALMTKEHGIALKIYKKLTIILSNRLRDTTERLAIANQIIRMTSKR